jgi:hypothetical protein
MAYKSTDILFRSLTDEEEADFRQWARTKYERGTKVSALWHPICRDEIKVMQMEDEWDKQQHNEAMDREDYLNA